MTGGQRVGSVVRMAMTAIAIVNATAGVRDATIVDGKGEIRSDQLRLLRSLEEAWWWWWWWWCNGTKWMVQP